MDKKTLNNKQTPAFFLLTPYFIGLAAGFILIILSAWADMEATFYGFPRQGDPGLSGFSCPVLMTRSDIGTITFVATNTADIQIRPSVRILMSSPALPEEHLERITLAPGESKRFEWRVDADNIDLNEFIFARVLMFSSYPLPTREAVCGIFVLDMPISGRILLPLLVAMSLFGMGWGLYAMNRSKLGGAEWIAKYLPALTFVFLVLILGFIFTYMGAWIQSILTLVVIALLLFILLSSFLLTEQRKQ